MSRPNMAVPFVYHPDYVAPLPTGHRFPMQKFQRLYEVLLRDGVATSEQFYLPTIATLETIQKIHNPDYVNAFCEGTLDAKTIRRIGLPWSPQLVKRALTAIGGTILTAELALKYGLACNTAGGTHHAFADYGSGFCIFNDLVIAARVLQDAGLVKKILIVDLDVHQGDGTAAVFQNDPCIATFSMHCDKNFPFRKQKSDLDVPLPVGTTESEYLRQLQAYLPDLLTGFQPDLVIYDAGVDVHQEDLLGRLALTTEGLFKREIQVLSTCAARGVPVACVVGGGYGDDLDALAYHHSLLHRAAKVVFKKLKL